MSKKGDGRVYRLAGRRTWMLDYWAPVNGKLERIRESSGTGDEETAGRIVRTKTSEGRVACAKGDSVETSALRILTGAELLDEYLRDLALREKKGVAAER